MTTEILKSASALIAEVDAHLDYHDDDDMQAAVEALRLEVEAGEVTAVVANTLINEVGASLELHEDADMASASEALSVLLPAPAEAAKLG